MTGIFRRLANRSQDMLFFPPMDRYWRRRAAGRVACLLYHRVAEPGRFPFMEAVGAPTITPDALAADLRFLRRKGARFMTFADLSRGEFPSEREFGVIVSFDDGFRDNYEEGLAVLNALGIRGIIFQSTALVDADRLIWEHALYFVAANPAMADMLAQESRALLPDNRVLEGKDLVSYLREHVPVAEVERILSKIEQKFDTGLVQADIASRLYPTAEHLRRARANGHEIGSHGHRHYKRSSIDSACFDEELKTSSQVLKRVLGETPTAFSYPFNSHLPGDADIAARYFSQAATVAGVAIERKHDPLWIPRFSWPGPAKNGLRARRWLWTGRI